MRSGRRVRRLETPGLFVYLRDGQSALQSKWGAASSPLADAPPLLTEETLDVYRTAAKSRRVRSDKGDLLCLLPRRPKPKS